MVCVHKIFPAAIVGRLEHLHHDFDIAQGLWLLQLSMLSIHNLKQAGGDLQSGNVASGNSICLPAWPQHIGLEVPRAWGHVGSWVQPHAHSLSQTFQVS